jgi:endonuclease IV
MSNIGGHVRLALIKDVNRPFQTYITSNRQHITDNHVNNVTIKPFDDKYFKIAHAPYVTNVWSDDDEIMNESLHDIKNLSILCNRLNFNGFVLHFPYSINDINRFEKQIKLLSEHCSSKIFFENISTKPDKDHHLLSFEPVELIKDYNNMIKKHIKSYGLCIDTAHLFGQGRSLSTVEDVQKFNHDMFSISDKIEMFHLNGNLLPFNSGTDKHTIAGRSRDMIWGNHHDGLKEMFKFIDNRPTILEIKGYFLNEQYDDVISDFIKIYHLY